MIQMRQNTFICAIGNRPSKYMISTLIFQVMLVCLFWLRHYSETKGNINYAATAVACFQLFYMFDAFLIEVSGLLVNRSLLERFSLVRL